MVKLTKGNKGISTAPRPEDAIYRADDSGNKVQLVGYDYNRARFAQIAEHKADAIGLRNDATAVGIERALAERDTQLWEEERAPLLATSLIPMDGRASAFADAEYYEWRKKEMFSDALIKGSLHGANSEIPDVSGSIKAELVDIWNVLAKYSVTLQERWFGGRLEFDFATEYAQECMTAIDRAIDQALMHGYSALGIEGFSNHSDISAVTATTGTLYTGGATSAQILEDFAKLINVVRDNVAYNSVVTTQMADTCLMSDRIHTFLASTKSFDSSGSEASMLEILTRRFPEINFDTFTNELRDKGASGTGYDRVILYRKDPRHVAASIPVPYQERPMITEAYSDVVYAFGRFVPVRVHDKRSIRYMDFDVTA